MTEERKQLLLKYLCMAQPYGVICKIHYSFNNETTFGEDIEAEADYPIVRIDVQAQTVYVDLVYDWFCIDEIKPYLRLMSSMTKEERAEMGREIQKDRIEPYGEIKNCGEDNLLLCTIRQSTNLQDWLLKNHFDFMGLIPKSLAIAVTEENNPYKE